MLHHVLRPNQGAGDRGVEPYGKGQGTSRSVIGIFGLVGLDNGIVSGLEKFEGQDPAYWCAHGYAICNPDIRGVANVEGDSVLWDRQEGQDCHDLIEWLVRQGWCTGKVAMSGTSYLAVAQWFTVAEQPAHLAAINPWVAVAGADDMDLFVLIQKLDAYGTPLGSDAWDSLQDH